MKNIWVWVVVIVVLVGGYFAFFNKLQQVNTEKIKIGVIAPLTGIAADYGAEMKAGIEAAGGTNVEFVYEDDKCDPKEAVTAYKKLVDFDKVSLIIGPACGSPQEAIAPLLKNNKIIAVVPSAASGALYGESGGNIYNMQYTLERESVFLAKKMYALGYKKIALVTYQNAFSRVLADSFKKEYTGQITKEIAFTGTETDISSGLLKLKGGDFDAIFSTDISFFFGQGLKKLKDLKINQPIFSSYAVELPAIRPLVEGVGYSFPSDMVEGKSAIYELSRQSVELLVAQARACQGEYVCMRKGIMGSGTFEENGASIRNLVLKRIKGGVPQAY